jgi:hypothetical protein
MTALDHGRLTAKKRTGHRHRDCSVCVPPESAPTPPRVERDERFWLDSGDLVHALPASDERPANAAAPGADAGS